MGNKAEECVTETITNPTSEAEKGSAQKAAEEAKLEADSEGIEGLLFPLTDFQPHFSNHKNK